ncbi:MAG TPA: GMC family oxidoreductase N-terminal domain-containing protein [Vicinamibacteria bacterium]|nr:GMC family oxidoreductase N-terminal domain-containing protein [Vicinamibacteria bacterium]
MTLVDTDVVVVGSGPGGATVARELVRRGRRVLLLERGVDERRRFYYGTYLGALLYTDRSSLLFTEEGLNVIRPLMLGGATSMYCGCAAPPPSWMKARYGVDLDRESAEAESELGVAPLPPEMRGVASTRLAEAAGEAGYAFFPQPKFMSPARAHAFPRACGARCMLGCRCGAKWNAAEWVDEAVAGGAELRTRAHVERVTIEGGQATGLEGRLAGSPFQVRAQTVVVAAGGIGTPRLLQASGLHDAGEGLTMDATLMVYGFVERDGIGREPPMTWSHENPDAGYMLSTLVDPWLLYPIMAALKEPRHALTWPRWGNVLGVMIKLKDEVSGGVFPDGRIRKPLTTGDRERLADAEEVCRRILVRAGAEPSSIFATPLRGTHPSGTVRIGTHVDRDLATPVRNLYACDASVFPEALDRPTVLTIVALAKRLAGHLAPGPVSRPSSRPGP